MNHNISLPVPLFYSSIKIYHIKKFFPLKQKIGTLIASEPADIDYIPIEQLNQQQRHVQYLVRFHYCCLIRKDIKKALLFYALAESESSEGLRDYFVDLHKTINEIQTVQPSSLCRQLSLRSVKCWQIYQLLAELMLSSCEVYIQESIKPLQKVIELNKQCAHAYIGLAYIYSLLMKRQKTLEYLDQAKSFTYGSGNIDLLKSASLNDRFHCESQVIILLLCEQYQRCLCKIKKCSHIVGGVFTSMSQYTLQNNLNGPYAADLVIERIKQSKKQQQRTYHEYYKLIGSFLMSSIPVNFLFILLNAQSNLNQRIFKARISIKYSNNINLGLNQYQQIEKIINQKSQQEITKQYLGIKTRSSLSLKQYIPYLFCYTIASVLCESEDAIPFCQKALQISKNTRMIPQIQKNDIFYIILAYLSQKEENQNKVFEYSLRAALYSNKKSNYKYYVKICPLTIALVCFYSKKYYQSLDIAKSIRNGSKNITSAIVQYIICMSQYYVGAIKNRDRIILQYINNHPQEKYLKYFYLGLGQYYMHFNQPLKQILKPLETAYKLNETIYLSQFQQQHFKKQVLHLMGMAYQLYEWLFKAIQYYSLAIELDCYQSVLDLGKVYHKLQKYEDEMLLYRRFLLFGKNPLYFQTIEQLGYAYAYLNQYTQAFQCFQDYNFINRKQRCQIGKAFVHKMQNQYLESINCCKKALQINQNALEIYFILESIQKETKDQKIKQMIIEMLKNISLKQPANKFSSAYLWNKQGNAYLNKKYFQRLEKAYNNIPKYSFQNENTINQLIGWKLKQGSQNKINKYFSAQNLLLNRILKNKQKCCEQLNIYFSRNKQGSQQLILNLLLWLKQFYLYRKQALLSFILQMDNEKSRTAIKICIQADFIRIKYRGQVSLALKQIIKETCQARNFLSIILSQDFDSLEKYMVEENKEPNALISNIKEIWLMYQSLRWIFHSQKSQSSKQQEFSKIINNHFEIKRIKLKKVPPLQNLFTVIQFQDSTIDTKLKQIKMMPYKKAYKKIKELIKYFYTEKYFKNELVKYIYKQTSSLYYQMGQSAQKQMIEFLTSFKMNQQNHLEYINELNLGLILLYNQTQVKSLNQIKKPPIVQPQVKISQQMKKHKSQLKCVFFFDDLSFLPSEDKRLIFFQQSVIYINNKSLLSRQQRKSQLIYLMFKNPYDIMSQLAKKQSKNIAKYTVQNKWSEQIVQRNLFQYQMEEGQSMMDEYQQLSNKILMKNCIIESNKILDRINLNGSEFELEDIKIIDHLWRKGPKQIIRFTIGLFRGFIELEQLKIIHLDLGPRSVIKVGETYKIKNFDYAFRYGGQIDCPSFKNLQSIINIMVQQNNSELGDLISYIFRDINHQEKQRLRQICLETSKQQVVNVLTKKLGQYAKTYHLKQLKRIMKFFVENKIMDKYKQFKTCVNVICNGNNAKSLLDRLDNLLKQM